MRGSSNACNAPTSGQLQLLLDELSATLLLTQAWRAVETWMHICGEVTRVGGGLLVLQLALLNELDLLGKQPSLALDGALSGAMED